MNPLPAIFVMRSRLNRGMKCSNSSCAAQNLSDLAKIELCRMQNDNNRFMSQIIKICTSKSINIYNTNKEDCLLMTYIPARDIPHLFESFSPSLHRI